MKNEPSRPTSGIIQRRTERLLVSAFAMVRRELGCTSDQQLADRMGLPQTYRHYLAGRRGWPFAAAYALVAASGREGLDDLLSDARRYDDA